VKKIVSLIAAFTMLFAGAACNNGKKPKELVTIGEPIVVAQGPNYDDVGWGPFQFPEAYITDDSKIVVFVNTGYDVTSDYEKPKQFFISSDDGETWTEAGQDFSVGMGYTGAKMSNGKNFAGFKPKNAYDSTFLNNYTAKVSSGWQFLYLADEIPEFSNQIVGREYDPQTKTINEFTATVNWPYMPVNQLNGKCMPLDAYFGLMPLNNIMQLSDGKLIAVMYCNGFNSETGELVTSGVYSNIYFFTSEDCGRTWDYYSQILATEKFVMSGGEGFDEPSMLKRADGSYVILMRTGSGKPSYIARSVDSCKTWSEPVVFDDIGVYPQMLALNCGVTFASYGRPGVYLRWTEDESALVWNEPISLGINNDVKDMLKATCGYTSLVALDDNTALVFYTDFNYPSLTDGSKTVKTLLVRKITVNKN